MKIGIIGSSNGSVAREIIEATSHTNEFFVITDRKCGLESVAEKYKLQKIRIIESDNRLFSEKSINFLEKNGGVDFVILFYLRLVSSELFNKVPTFNIHPSLLPDYRGFKAIERAHNDNVKIFGATLHLVGEIADSGKIIAQTSVSISSKESLDKLYKISFIQKTFLAFYLLDKIISVNRDQIKSKIISLNPSKNLFIQNSSINKHFAKFIKREKYEGFI